MAIPQRVETSRLVLRRPTPADAAAIRDGWAADAEATRYMSWPRHLSEADTAEFIEFSDREWTDSPGGPYLIEVAADGRVIGSCGFEFAPDGTAEVGYILSRDGRGFGYATEALLAQVDVARALAPLVLTALVHPANDKSIAVLRRCGFVHDQQAGKLERYPNLDGALVESLGYRRVVDADSRPPTSATAWSTMATGRGGAR